MTSAPPVLLDTQAVFWSTLEPWHLSRRAAEAIAAAYDAQLGVAIASSTLWELAMMITRGRVTIDHSLTTYLRLVEERFAVFPINAEIAERSMNFSANFPKDPTDRIVAATALVHGLKLITADRPILDSGEVPCIW